MADQGIGESDLAIICAVVDSLGRRGTAFRVKEGNAGWKRTFACDGLLDWKSASTGKWRDCARMDLFKSRHAKQASFQW